jgi:hypothetical protein
MTAISDAFSKGRARAMFLGMPIPQTPANHRVIPIEPTRAKEGSISTLVAPAIVVPNTHYTYAGHRLRKFLPITRTPAMLTATPIMVTRDKHRSLPNVLAPAIVSAIPIHRTRG